MHLSYFLISNVYQRRTKWLIKCYDEGVFNKVRRCAPFRVNYIGYADATPFQWSVASTQLGLEHIEPLPEQLPIYYAEGTAAIKGMLTMFANVLDFSDVVLYIDNQSVFHAVRKGSGLLFDNDVFCTMYLDIIKNATRGASWRYVPTKANLAGCHSRTVLPPAI